MITSKKEYNEYMELDKKVMMISDNIKTPRMFRDYEWKFVRLLRRVEYYQNCK